jgi:lipoprotein-releasing system permease protein
VVVVKGVDANYRYVTGVSDHLIKGDYDLGTADAPSLILGGGIENALGIEADRNIFGLLIYLPRKNQMGTEDFSDNIRIDTIRSSAAFVIQQDFDNKYGITNVDFMKRALRLADNEYSNIEIKVSDPSKADDVRADVQKIFADGYKVENRFQQNQSLYSVMNMERWVIYGVLSLILVVAAFTMISALRMLILEKEKDINVLYALGGNKNFIQKIFLSEGLLLAIIGGAIGMLLALVIALLQIRYHLIPLQGGSFLIDYFPVKLQWTNFLLVGVTVFIISLVASWLPSRKVFDHEFSLRSE